MLQIFKIGGRGAPTLEVARLPRMPENAGKPGADELWLNLEDPDPAELKYAATLFKIPEDFLGDSLDPAERPRAAHAGDASLIIARASYHPELEPDAPGDPDGDPDKREEQSYPTVPIGIVLTESAIITICRVPGLVSDLLGPHIPAGRARERVCIAMRLLEKISTRFMKHLQKLDELSNRIEEAMQLSTRNEDLRRILQLEKTMVYFLNALKANALVLEKLLGSGFNWEGDEPEKLADALIECRQAVEMAEIFTKIIANMSDIYASMISNNMNSVMKFLAAITLILMAPSIIVGAFGMNVPLPLENSRWGLPLISLGTALVCWLLWRYLLKKHWM